MDHKSRLVAAKIYLNNSSPFFSTLVNNIKIEFSPSGENGIPTAATDGKRIIFNEDFAATLDDKEFCGVLAHEVLHMALSHVYRFKSLPMPDDKPKQYYMYIANYAADIVVNGIINACGNTFKLPPGGISDTSLEKLSFPEIYASLLKDPPIDYEEVNVCFGASDDSSDEDSDGDADGMPSEGISDEEMEQAMSELLQQAKIAEELYGNTTQGLIKHLKGVDFEDHTNYEQLLSRFLINTKESWGGYDRRFIHQDLYLDDAESNSLNINLFIDTSGSVDEEKLGKFISCVEDYLSLSKWAKINRQCFFFDTKIYGPFDEFSLDNIQGFGGTDFFPVISKIEEIEESSMHGASMVNLIYTDGWSRIPIPPVTSNCDENTIWLISQGGAPIKEFNHFGWPHAFQIL